MPSKQERLTEVFRRMAKADPCCSFDEAYRLLCTTIDQVEDELSGQPNEPDRWKELDRIFPPKMDRMSSVEGTDMKRFDSLRHLIYITPSGAIEIRLKRLVDGKVVVHFSKLGSDGRNLCDRYPQLNDKNL